MESQGNGGRCGYDQDILYKCKKLSKNKKELKYLIIH